MDRSKYKKYPSTPHLPWSPGTTESDVFVTPSVFEGKEVVVTEKMDGENCLHEDSLICTEIGYKSIRWICEKQFDGRVMALNTCSGVKEWKPIKNWYIQPSQLEWYELETATGHIVRLTGEHRVWLPLKGEYEKISELSGDESVFVHEDWLHEDVFYLPGRSSRERPST